MNLALLILQYFLFSLFLFCLRVAVLVYRYRLPIIRHEFEFSQTTKLLIWAIRRVVLPFTFLGIVIEIVNTQNFWLIIALVIGFILPSFFFLGKKPKNIFLSAVDEYFYTRRANLFESCPRCKDSKVFYCKLYEVEPSDMEVGERIDDNCYYLISKEGQLYSLGFLYDINSLALAFIEEPHKFNSYLNQFYPLLEPYQSLANIVETEEEIFWQEPDLFCSKCHEQVNQTPIYLGRTFIK